MISMLISNICSSFGFYLRFFYNFNERFTLFCFLQVLEPISKINNLKVQLRPFSMKYAHLIHLKGIVRSQYTYSQAITLDC